jgi:hypothetical protein
MKNLKLQSAMEYLMTYGWAILIIAVVMVALFSLGILGGSPLSTTCLPLSGFQCSGLILSHITGGATFILGQTTGTNWYSANIFYVPQGTATVSGVPSTIPSNTVCGSAWSTYAACNAIPGGLISGATYTNANVPVTQTSTNPISAGTSKSGQFWVGYTVQNTAGVITGPYYVQVATVTMKAS